MKKEIKKLSKNEQKAIVGGGPCANGGGLIYCAFTRNYVCPGMCGPQVIQ